MSNDTPPAWTHSFVGRGKKKPAKPRKRVTAREIAEAWVKREYNGIGKKINHDISVDDFLAGFRCAQRLARRQAKREGK